MGFIFKTGERHCSALMIMLKLIFLAFKKIDVTCSKTFSKQ